MKTARLLAFLAAMLMMADFCPAKDKEDNDSGDKETITVIKPGRNGDVRILSLEQEIKKKDKKDRTDVPKDTTPRKARVVVVPAVYTQMERSKGDREFFEKLGVSDPTIYENPGYTGFFVDALVNCRKFDVLEREALKAATKELDLGESEYADTATVVRLGKLLNADYVAIPEITFVEIKKGEPVPYIGEAARRLEGTISVGIRLVTTSTSRIASSYRYTTTVKRSRKQNESEDKYRAGLLGELFAKSSMEGASHIIDVVYPIRILLVNKDYCVINRGKGAIVKGEALQVFKPGEILIDPDTGENLGYHEAQVGKLKVTKVSAKTSRAEIVSGADKIEKLFLCRRQRHAGEKEIPAPRID